MSSDRNIYNVWNMKQDAQREFVANCLDIGPGWTIGDERYRWQRLFDLLLSILLEDGPKSFYREIGRMRVERVLG